jgi:hypothetical protein
MLYVFLNSWFLACSIKALVMIIQLLVLQQGTRSSFAFCDGGMVGISIWSSQGSLCSCATVFPGIVKENLSLWWFCVQPIVFLHKLERKIYYETKCTVVENIKPNKRSRFWTHSSRKFYLPKILHVDILEATEVPLMAGELFWGLGDDGLGYISATPFACLVSLLCSPWLI